MNIIHLSVQCCTNFLSKSNPSIKNDIKSFRNSFTSLLISNISKTLHNGYCNSHPCLNHSISYYDKIKF